MFILFESHSEKYTTEKASAYRDNSYFRMNYAILLFISKRKVPMWASLKAELIKNSWREALDAFRLYNLGMLLLVSLRALKDLYKALLHAWFLPIALIVGLLLDIKGLIAAFYVTLLARAARPSVELKREVYWNHLHFVDWILFFGLFLVIDGLKWWFYNPDSLWYLIFFKSYDGFLKLLFLGNNFPWLPDGGLLGIMLYFLSPFIIVWALFMLDAKKTIWGYISAFGRTFLMLLYNYPFFLITYVALRLAINGFYMSERFFFVGNMCISIISWIALFTVLIPLYVCFIMSFYVKQIHEQFGLYYKS